MAERPRLAVFEVLNCPHGGSGGRFGRRSRIWRRAQAAQWLGGSARRRAVSVGHDINEFLRRGVLIVEQFAFRRLQRGPSRTLVEISHAVRPPALPSNLLRVMCVDSSWRNFRFHPRFGRRDVRTSDQSWPVRDLSARGCGCALIFTRSQHTRLREDGILHCESRAFPAKTLVSHLCNLARGVRRRSPWVGPKKEASQREAHSGEQSSRSLVCGCLLPQHPSEGAHSRSNLCARSPTERTKAG